MKNKSVRVCNGVVNVCETKQFYVSSFKLKKKTDLLEKFLPVFTGHTEYVRHIGISQGHIGVPSTVFFLLPYLK